MFDTNIFSVSHHVNSVTGNIVKTYKDSYFKRFHLKSALADTLFSPTSEIIVVQMVMCGDMDVIAELITKPKYEKIFDEK